MIYISKEKKRKERKNNYENETYYGNFSAL